MVINFNVWVGGHFLVSSLDSRCSSDNISGIFMHALSTTYWQMMVIHLMILRPTQAGALQIIFLKLEQGIINFYQFFSVGKKLKAQMEGAIHAVKELFDLNCDAGWGLLLVDAKNAFNYLNRVEC